MLPSIKVNSKINQTSFIKSTRFLTPLKYKFILFERNTAITCHLMYISFQALHQEHFDTILSATDKETVWGNQFEQAHTSRGSARAPTDRGHDQHPAGSEVLLLRVNTHTLSLTYIVIVEIWILVTWLKWSYSYRVTYFIPTVTKASISSHWYSNLMLYKLTSLQLLETYLLPVVNYKFDVVL